MKIKQKNVPFYPPQYPSQGKKFVLYEAREGKKRKKERQEDGEKGKGRKRESGRAVTFSSVLVGY